MQERLEALEQKILKLEAQNRKLRWYLVAALALSAFPYLIAAQLQPLVSPVIRAERIEFVQKGETVASLVPHPKGDGVLFLNKDGEPVAEIYSILGIRGLNIYTKDRKIIVRLIASPNGGYLGISNKEGNTVAALSAFLNGGFLDISNNGGKTVAALSADTSGGSLDIRNKESQTIASLFTDPDSGVGRLEFIDPKRTGKTAPVVITVAKNGSGFIGTSDAFGNILWASPLK